jgi:hypothetical protein
VVIHFRDESKGLFKWGGNDGKSEDLLTDSTEVWMRREKGK